MRFPFLILPIASYFAVVAAFAEQQQYNSSTISGLGARNIGSATMSGRISAIAATHEPAGKTTVFVGAASGGVWKSDDGGTRYRPVFDEQPVQSIGAIALDPKNTKNVWVGTGECWTRNSVSIGNAFTQSRMISLVMPATNTERERQRLTELYSGMTDGELQEIADPSSLTEAAQEVLTAEIARRNLTLAALPAPATDIELLDLVTIRQFRDLPEAILARGILDSAGIESFLADENIVRMDWFISNLVGGVKLKVRREDVEAARS